MARTHSSSRLDAFDTSNSPNLSHDSRIREGYPYLVPGRIFDIFSFHWLGHLVSPRYLACLTSFVIAHLGQYSERQERESTNTCKISVLNQNQAIFVQIQHLR